jgi:hypothetical protein
MTKGEATALARMLGPMTTQAMFIACDSSGDWFVRTRGELRLPETRGELRLPEHRSARNCLRPIDAGP